MYSNNMNSYVQVSLLHRDVKLWYKIPDHFQHAVKEGTLVTVPLLKKTELALVISCHEEIPETNFKIKPIISLEKMPDDKNYITYIKKIAWYYQIDYRFLLMRLQHFLKSKEKKDDEMSEKMQQQAKIPHISTEQQYIVDAISGDIKKSKYTVSVIHGVTGSGKTEIYKGLIKEAIAQKKTVLFLLPEVTLSIAFEQRLSFEMPEIPLFGFHSGKTQKEKRIVFDSLIKNQPIVILGVHLPAMLPIQNLGLIIIDEEHDGGFQEKKFPKLHTKEIALFRAHIYNIPIVLGSATPSIATLHNVESRGWKLYTLQKRFSGAFPVIKQVSLLTRDSRKCFWISKTLQNAIQHRLEKKEQVIIFINRRGLHFFIQCGACSFIFTCVSCAVSLTLHENSLLVCHYCGYSIATPSCCSQCKQSEKKFIKKGVGTQQIAKNLEQLFPTARIARLDADIVKKKGSSKQIFDAMHQRKIDILVGTQSITKGLHFEYVSLVGIIWADLHVHIPMFNAVEQSIQQLIQVAGRAGRSNKTEENEVIVQSLSSHDALSFVTEEKYIQLYEHEQKQRKQFLYPPFVRLAEIEITSDDEAIVAQESAIICEDLLKESQKNKYEIQVLGPTKPPVSKINNIHRRKMYIKAKKIEEIIVLYAALDKTKFKASLHFIPNAVSI